MEFRALARPVIRATANAPRVSLPVVSARGHKTTSRTKRSIKIAPHDSFLPDRKTAFPAADSIIYNPPSSAASPLHTPFVFLPTTDARRAPLTRMRHEPNSPLAPVPEGELPPEMRYKRRNPSYHITAEQVKEMKALRAEDPSKWTCNVLAEKFSCSVVFVKMAAPAPYAHLKELEARQERREARWGPIRTKAREDRKRRTGMLYRGEL